MRRRDTLGALVTSPLLAGASGIEGRYALATPKTFLLVHGLFTGGWVWKYVVDGLRARGHLVVHPTHTGLGDREHLLSRDVGLQTHVSDLLSTIQFEGLTDIILVAQDFGAVPASIAAAQVIRRVRHLVYLDGVVPALGAAAVSILPRGTRAELTAVVESLGQGFTVPVASQGSLNVPSSNPNLEWFVSRLRPHPLKAITEPSTYALDAARVPITYLHSNEGRGLALPEAHAHARSMTQWKLRMLDWADYPNVFAAFRLTEILAAVP